jgi:hypothetical protein
MGMFGTTNIRMARIDLIALEWRALAAPTAETARA